MNQLHLLLIQTEIAILLAFLMFIEARRRGWDMPPGRPGFSWSPARGPGKRLAAVAGWMIHNIGSPGVCLAAITAGVLCANHLAGLLVDLVVMQPLPLIDAGGGIDFALAVLVSNRSGYRRWLAAAATPCYDTLAFPDQ
jgi:hypothetical protein